MCIRPSWHHKPRASPTATAAAGGEGRWEPAADGLPLEYTSIDDTSEQVVFPLTVPLLPFPVEEVLLPGSVKALHLFEPRYLSLLEEALAGPGSNKYFGHVVIEQLGDVVGSKASGFPGAYVGDGFVLLMATLVRVRLVKPLKVGCLVRIHAEGRVAITDVKQMRPFIRGTVVPLPDDPLPDDQQQVAQQMQQLQSTMQDLQNLTMKFKSKQTAAIQQAMIWWYRQPLVPMATGCGEITTSSSSSRSIGSSWCEPSIASSSSSRHEQAAASSSGNADDAPSTSDGSALLAAFDEQASRLSFAALQAVPEASPKEQLKLLRCRVNAMETSDTAARLSMVQQHMEESCKLLAAKCALKSLQLPGSTDW